MSDAISLESHSEPVARGRLSVRILVGLGSLVLVAVAGYAAFLVFATTAPVLTQSGYLLVAVVAGAGAFFSPCSFPLLPSYFAYAQVAHDRRDGGRARALSRGLAAGAGVVCFNGILGVVFGVAGLGVAQSFVLLSPNPSAVTVGLRSVVGVALLALGIVQVANVSLHGGLLDRAIRYLQPGSRSRDPFVRLFLYGFAYTTVGIGCTAPFLATVILVSLTSGGFLLALAGFLAFSLTMAALMVVVSVLASTSRRRLLRGLSARTPAIKRGGGIALAAFGALLLVTTAWPAILGPLFPP